MGAAMVVAGGIRGDNVLKLSKELIKATHTYVPNIRNREVYERNYRVFKKLYKNNASGFKEINS